MREGKSKRGRERGEKIEEENRVVLVVTTKVRRERERESGGWRDRRKKNDN